MSELCYLPSDPAFNPSSTNAFLKVAFPNLGLQSYRRQFHWREHEVCLAQATDS